MMGKFRWNNKIKTSEPFALVHKTKGTTQSDCFDQRVAKFGWQLFV